MRVFIVGLFCLVAGYSLISLYHICMTTAPDFTVYYQSTKDILFHSSPYTDKNLFTAFNYPLITTALFLPLIFLKEQVAQILFTMISYGCLFGCVVVSMNILKWKIRLVPLLFICSLSLVTFPTKFTLGMGQINLIALFFLLLFFLRYQQGEKDSLVWFIIACICKPILLFMLLFLAFKKKWKVVGVFIGIVGLLGICYPYIFGLQWTTYYYAKHVVPQLLGYSGREVYYNQGLSGFIARLLPTTPLRQLWSTFLNFVIIGVCGFVFRKKVSDNALFSLLLTLLVIVDGLSWQHHFVFLLFPFLYIWDQQTFAKRPLFIGVSILAYLLVSLNIKTPQQFISFPSVLLLSHVFYGSLLLLGLQIVVQWRNTHSR